jgi:hypothetical protein
MIVWRVLCTRRFFDVFFFELFLRVVGMNVMWVTDCVDLLFVGFFHNPNFDLKRKIGRIKALFNE